MLILFSSLEDECFGGYIHNTDLRMMIMRKSISTVFYVTLAIGIFTFLLPTIGMGKSNWQPFQNHGLTLSYPSEWKRMSPKSTDKIQGMLNQQLQGIGNTQVSVIGLDVLLNLPTFRVMIAKEQFVSVPTPEYLIEERGKFLKEAQMRGGVNSYGEMKPLTINGYSAIEFLDVDKGARGYSSSVRLLCGKDTWHVTFTGSTKTTYQEYRPKIEEIMQSMSLVDQCDASL